MVTSDNNEIDKFIKDTQSSAHNDVRGVLEWIPYDRFYGVKYISKDEFGEVYRANWVDGYISNFQSWDDVNQNWERNNFNMFVNLKILNTPNDLTFELANKIKIEYEFYGMTQDPETKKYMVVLNNKCKKCNTYNAKGGFSTVYQANWIDGYIDEWDNEEQNWKMKGKIHLLH
ncbi:kinase-like domain-containing protein [Rhizophagus irregularis DAOM 181602=DAOM 197198]|nr:kinase-like domain-containing protein [Rhizophagus irregularis DAOM 181602=DAOM 197198]